MKREEVDLCVGLGNVRAGLADLLLRVEQGELLRDQLVHEVTKACALELLLFAGASKVEGLSVQEKTREVVGFCRMDQTPRKTRCVLVAGTRHDGDEGRRGKRLPRNGSPLQTTSV